MKTPGPLIRKFDILENSVDRDAKNRQRNFGSTSYKLQFGMRRVEFPPPFIVLCETIFVLETQSHSNS